MLHGLSSMRTLITIRVGNVPDLGNIYIFFINLTRKIYGEGWKLRKKKDNAAERTGFFSSL